MIRSVPPPRSRGARKFFLCLLTLSLASVALLTIPRGLAFGPMPPMPLGNYANTAVQLGANITVTPDAPPTATTSINVSTSTNFKGKLEGDPTTGVVRITDAHPAGTYTVTVTAFDGGPSTKTFTLTVTTPVTCNPVTFAAATNLATANRPFSVAVGDFNGDGKQDLATANDLSNNVSVALGDGAGSFGAATNFAAGALASSVAVGDFNGDGKQDLVAANNNASNVSVLLGNGAGSFSAATNFAAGNRPISVAVGDFNGDGKQDLAVANFNSSDVSVLLGNGAGSFSAATNFAVGGSPRIVAIGDFNADGKQDLAVSSQGSGVSVLLGNGLGSFGGATNFPAGTLPSSVAIGDFNDDGKQDLALTNFSSNNVSVLLGNGAGSFSAPANFAVGTNPFSLAVGDFNGDGKQDLVAANEASSNVSLLLGNGAGAFSAATNFGAGTNPRSVAVGDFNGDGKQDLAITNFNFDIVSVLIRQCPASPTLTVTNTNNSGAGSLRQAITDSNATGGTVETITFNIPGVGVHTISPTSALPGIAASVIIDGYTQPGASANTLSVGDNAVLLIEVNGASASNSIGFTITGGNSTVRGLVVNSFNFDGISLQGGGNTIQGNFIGTNASGSGSAGNAGYGVQIQTPNNLIGGTTPAARNLISGNSFGGLQLVSDNATGNVIQGNYIGTNAAGASGIPNNGSGVEISQSASGNTIGGAAAGAANLISFNGSHGVRLVLDPANNFVQGNVIAGNAANGIDASFDGSGNRFFANSIDSNGQLGIDLSPTGVTPNDAGDPDGGPNQLQNFPVITSATTSGGVTNVSGTFNSASDSTNFRLEFFANTACDASGNGEGARFLGFITTNTDGQGNTVFTNVTLGATTAGEAVTATATDSDGNTSEFSACRQVAAPASFSISGRALDDSANALSGVAVALSGSASAITTTDATGNYSFVSVAGGGNYTITPSSSNFSFSPASQTFNNLDVNRIANFVGTRTVVTITGNITDSNNNPINNVTVALTKNGAATGTTQTDGLGNYSFANLAAGANYLVTPAGTFTPSSQTFSNLTTNAVANFKAAPSIPSQCNTAGFTAATNFAVGATPNSVAVGDFNGDGKPDLAAANRASANVSILLGSGTGSFSAPTNFAVGSNPESVAVGDFNVDGDLDLAVANNASNNVSVLLGTGTGTFGASTNFAAGSQPQSVAVGDFNGDGQLDLAVANGVSGNVSILLGSGTGGFSAATNFAVGSAPVFIAVGDFNGDGKPDLAAANMSSNDVSILLGSGTGSFGAAINFAVGSGPASIAIGDFNGDGKLDLAVTNQSPVSNNVSILLGSGTGAFGAATNFAAGSQPASLAVGDLNGDGKLDLAVANATSNSLLIFLGTGTGSFSAAINFVVGTSRSVAVGDFNADTKLDVAELNFNTNNASFILNTGATCNTQNSLTISGQVLDTNNNPLADVTVTLSGTVTRVVQSDSNGNYAFTNLPPGGNYSVTLQSNYFVFASSRSDFLNLSSNQTPNFVAAPVAVPSPTPPLSDDFNGPTRDPNKWNLGTLSQSPGAVDPQVTTGQISGQLVITPRSQVSGLHYNGYVSANSFDMRNGRAGVEVVKAATGGADTIFAVGSDADNFYRFMVHTPGAPTTLAPTTKGIDDLERPLDETVAQLVFQIKVGGQLTSLSINYDPVLHRFMRFRHEPPTNSIVFETSPDGIAYTVRQSVVLQKGVSALTAELSAGTSSPTNPGGAVFDNFGLITSTFQFSAGTYAVGESDGSVLITVTRSGSTTDAASVHYETADGTAAQANKYIKAVGTLSFAPGQTSKTFSVLIVDNAFTDGNEALNLLLSNPTVSGLNSPGRAVLTITDNDTTRATGNPLDDPSFFVRQQYFDFLNREPDASGLAFWINEITQCGSNTQCVEVKRINVSAAFFLSIEFQETGYLVYRIYEAAYGNLPGTPVPVRYGEFLPDTQQIGQGVVVGQTGWEQALESNKVAFTLDFVSRSRFTTALPTTRTPAEFVDALYLNAGVTPSATERTSVISEFGSATTTSDTAARGRVLRRVAENSTLTQQEFNRAFVLMQYFGYLRRNPNDAPDADFGGYNFWLGKLNQFNGNFVNAEMVKAFIVSDEYKRRFGP